MGKWKGGLLLSFAILSVLAWTACPGFFIPETVTSISITPQNASVTVGGTTQLTATGVNNDGTPANLSNVSWSSSNTQIATVSAAGVVTGVSSGTATITATAGTVSGTTSVTVSTSNNATLTITPANQIISSTLGAVQFSATFNGQDVTASSIWTSSNPVVAQFSIGTTTGMATFVGQGSTTITAQYSNGGSTVTGSTTLTVGP